MKDASILGGWSIAMEHTDSKSIVLYERVGLSAWPSIPCLQKHVARYNFAFGYCRGKNVCDVGSGLGWGSLLLSNVADHVVGVELDQSAYLTSTHLLGLPGNIEFVNYDWMGFDAEAPFDTVVAFEVFEHIASPLPDVLKHTYNQIAPNGLMVASLPINQGNNPFHVAGDMSYSECRQAFTDYVEWHDYEFFYQMPENPARPNVNVSIYPEDTVVVDPTDKGIVVFVGYK